MTLVAVRAAGGALTAFVDDVGGRGASALQALQRTLLTVRMLTEAGWGVALAKGLRYTLCPPVVLGTAGRLHGARSADTLF